ncbi:MAG: T9SS type A sorting domain-containing protein [Ignavibacteriales bacterium]|nr:T9SS type A sorting domain-containing protein [Ignavibacteriales bacterium]
MKKIILTIAFLIVLPIAINGQVIFEGNFESGNINTVTTTDSISYTVTTKQDIGGRWFYFRMRNVKNRFVKVTITSTDVKRAVYSYNDKDYYRFSAAESPQSKVFQKTYEQDTVYVAYYVPYNYSYLQERLGEWKESAFVKIDTLGLTLRNLPLQEMRITDNSEPDSTKYRVWIHARTHPGETPTSWQFDGLIDKLLQEDEVISEYRKKIIFHTVPFTNPDGVYYGRSRTNYDGIDVESNWNKSASETCKEVQLLKERMSLINSEKVLSVFSNIHSQASPFCTFWIHTAASTSDAFYRRQIQFANLNTSNNPYFVPSDYSFSSLSMTFPEGWLWSNHGEQVLALTYETPYDFYSTGSLVTNDNLKWLGERLLYSIAEFLEISHPKYLLLDNKDLVTNWRTESTGLEFFSNNYNSAYYSDNFGDIDYETEAIQPGNYEVWGWWPSSNSNASNTKMTINSGSETITKFVDQRYNGAKWNLLGNVNLRNSGKINISISDSAAGRIVADAIKIIYKGVPTSAEETVEKKDFIMYQNYPNPFNGTTTIKFYLKETNKVKMLVYNSLGETVAKLVDDELGEGYHQIVFDTNNINNLASGVYYLQLITNKYSETKGMLLLK